MADPEDETSEPSLEPSGDTWLTRLSADEWLKAGAGELVRATEALLHKQQRMGVAQARRAAGMAWNAVLLQIADVAERALYGRSYMDHLKVLREEMSVSPAVRQAATTLVGAPLEQVLIQLGAGDTRVADAAEVIVAEARRRVRGEGQS